MGWQLGMSWPKKNLRCAFSLHTYIYIYARKLAEDERIISLETGGKDANYKAVAAQSMQMPTRSLSRRFSEIDRISRSRRVCTPHFGCI